MSDYCQRRLLVVGPASDLKAFDRDADWTETLGATDIALQEHSPTRRVWQFVTESPALKSLRVISRRWPCLTFFLNYDCEDNCLVGLVRAKNGNLRHHRLKY
ncbi:MAG: hypothetical protein MUE94_11830 [Verrucomicrobia bacterium]|nr:hypothetical protein [Verrucomicrobiota bacterium]